MNHTAIEYTASLYHAKVRMIVNASGGDGSNVTRDHTEDSRYDGKTPQECAEKELSRQQRNEEQFQVKYN